MLGFVGEWVLALEMRGSGWLVWFGWLVGCGCLLYDCCVWGRVWELLVLSKREEMLWGFGGL